jgi:hypothetical protein
MPERIVRKERNSSSPLEENMRKFKKFRPHALAAPIQSRQRWVRSRQFRLLLAAVAGACLFLTAAFAPSANAVVLVYFNFEHTTVGGPPDFASRTIGPPDNNPGGGLVLTTLQPVPPLTNFGMVPGLLLNRTPGDIDTNVPGVGLGMRTTPADNGGALEFQVDTTFFQNMSLSFAVNTQGNGFNMVTLNYSTDGGGNFIPIGSSFIASGGDQLISFAIPVGAEGQSNVIFQLVWDGGTSSGEDLQTVVDNIVLEGIVIPEPATVVGGLLGVLGLGWQQRRRLIRSVRFRRAG